MTDTNFYIGTSGYAYKEWKGKFYPQDLPAAKMLEYYAQHFNAVEANNTFYRMPKAAVLESWAQQVPADFKFVIKSPQSITHFKRLKEAGESVAYLLKTVGVLKERLGPLLFQLPGNFKKDLPRLGEFLKLLPKEQRVAFEFRHESWFDQVTFDLLREHQTALCLAEAGEGVNTPFVSTAGWGYVRLRMVEYSDADLRKWIKRIKEQEWQDVFVFFKHEDEGTGPVFATRVQELLAGKKRK
jgi:uncharacterized protein YecE (DUF72 family)